MPLVISDETLRAAGLSESGARIEIAIAWFDAGKLTMGHAAAMAEMSEVDFEIELARRNISRYRYTEEMFDRDVNSLKKIDRKRARYKLSELLAACEGPNPHRRSRDEMSAGLSSPESNEGNDCQNNPGDEKDQCQNPPQRA